MENQREVQTALGIINLVQDVEHDPAKSEASVKQILQIGDQQNPQEPQMKQCGESTPVHEKPKGNQDQASLIQTFASDSKQELYQKLKPGTSMNNF